MKKMTTQKTRTNVVEVFEELKEKGLIRKERKLKESKFFSNFKNLGNTIFFNPSFKNLNKNYLRLILLHEEAHATKKQRSKYVIISSLILSFFSFCIFNIWLFKMKFIYSFILSLVILFSVFRLSFNYLKKDEFEADLFACSRLKEHYKIKNVSKLLENSLKSIHIKKKKNYSLFIKLYKIINYHPTMKERVNRIKTILEQNDNTKN